MSRTGMSTAAQADRSESTTIPELPPLNEKDISFLEFIEKTYSQESVKSQNLNEIADSLLSRLKAAAKEKREIQLYSDLINSREMDAAGILSQSGEAILYKNEADRLCIEYKPPNPINNLIQYLKNRITNTI